ncbi:MAG: hypothetical protein LBT01_05285 [Spirochaetaceae bacterium]|nr:hypothetical protein [Spirochaetaceae bacterium]
MVKKILILTDEAASSRAASLAISSVLLERNVTTVCGTTLQGTDILAADFCFFGCEKPAPPSFAYLEKLMHHINLSLRSCAVFSCEPEASAYLTKLIADSGIKMKGCPFVGSNLSELKIWAQRCILNSLPQIIPTADTAQKTHQV